MSSKSMHENKSTEDFSGSSVVQNPPRGFNPCSRKVPRAAVQLSLCADTTKAQVPSQSM